MFTHRWMQPSGLSGHQSFSHAVYTTWPNPMGSCTGGVEVVQAAELRKSRRARLLRLLGVLSEQSA